MEITNILQLSWNATTSFVNPPRSLTQKIEFLPTCFLQTPHGCSECSPESSAWPMLSLHHMTFVFPAFTRRPFFSIPSFHFLTFSNNNFFVSTIRTIIIIIIIIIIKQVLHLRLLNKPPQRRMQLWTKIQLNSSVFSSFLNIVNDIDGSLRTGRRLFQATGPA